MKILFVTELTHAGGVDTFLSSLLSHWPYTNDELLVHANVAHPGLPFLQLALKGRAIVEAHQLPTFVDWKLTRNARGLGFLRLLSPFLRVYFALRSYLGFIQLYRKICPDRVVIVAGGYPGGDSCRAAALAWSRVSGNHPKAIFNFHNLAVPIKLWQFVEPYIDRLLARSVGGFVAVSEACAMSMQVRPAIWSTRMPSFILNGIVPPIPPVCDVDVRKEFDFPSGCPLVAMLATYEPRKGHALLLRAFVKVVEVIPNARLIICGYGYPSEVQRMRRLSEELGINHVVVFVGFRKDAHQILSNVDVLAVPTQAYESFGLVAAEAMSMGVPVVATRIGGLPEVVENGVGGYLVSPTDETEFASRLIELLSDSKLRLAQGQLGKMRYRRLFTVSRMAADYAEVIRGESGAGL